MEKSFVTRFKPHEFNEKIDIFQNFSCLLVEFSDSLSQRLIDSGFAIFDLTSVMARELIETRNPSQTLRASQEDVDFISAEVSKYLSGHHFSTVIFTEEKKAYHILSDPDFSETRTNRNRNRITKEEQSELSKSRIGIVGMSVGRSALSTLVHEGIGGTIKIADGDKIELSNLNRIRTGYSSIGELKTLSAAKEIAELNPFVDVVCYNNYLTEHSMESFMSQGGNLNILIDECDDLKMKILLRRMARSLRIPVLMETSDRGMIDVERFDLEPERPIFHGQLDDNLDVKNLSKSEARMNALFNIVDINKVSNKGKASLSQIGSELLSWPQLASAVTLGGALITHVSREILLNRFTKSGRYYVDLNELIA